MSASPLTSGSGTLAYVSTFSGFQPQVTSSARAASHQSPGSVLLTFEEATESAWQLTSSASILSSIQATFAGFQPSSLPTVSSSRGEAGTAMHDQRDLVVSLPSHASKLLAVSEHTEEVETTHVPVETHSVNPPSQGCT